MSRIDHEVQQNTIKRLLDNGGIYSQAQNFLGVISTDVDPRTGQFMLAINLPTLIGNNLSGPSLTPTLSYNAQASLQNKGFGLGWSLLLSEIVWTATSSSLRLSSGEQFSIDRKQSEPGGKVVFLDHKLDDMLVSRICDDSFRIDRKTGEVEILTRQNASSSSYHLSEMRTAEGRRLFVTWRLGAPETFRLDKITDETGRILLAVETATGLIRFVINPEDASQAQPHTLVLSLANDRVSSVQISNLQGAFNFTYQQHDVGNGVRLWFPSGFSGPLGASDTVIWTADASAGHRLPEGAPLTHLPRVASWMQSSGSPDTVLTHRYEWVGQTNFLGFGSSLGFDWEDGRDNLYQVEHGYQYTSIETQQHSDTPLLTVKRTWNNFHLIVETMTTSGETEVTTSTTYGINDQVGWGSQPAYCQLPKTLTKTYRHKKTNAQRSEVTEYTYDNSGNILTVKYPTGVTECNTYYSADSTDGCPSDALAAKLGIVRFLQKKITTPAPSEFPAPTLSTTYEYKNLASLAQEEKEQPHAVVVKETVTNETDNAVMEITEQTYEETITSPHYGRETSAITTLNGKATKTVFTYELADDQLTTQMTVEGHDVGTRPASRSVTSSCRSTLTGLTEKETSAAGVVTAYEYDLLGRLVKTVIAKGTPYQASRNASYYINDKDFIALNRPEGITATVATEEADASAQWRRTWLDGAGRPVCIELEDLDHSPGVFREISRTTYDPLGRAVSQTNREWFEGQEVFVLTTTTDYDDWGNVSTVTSPSGVKTCSLHDPVNLCSEQWQESTTGKASSKQVTWTNVAGSPIKHELYDDKGSLVRTTKLARDGLDRVVEQTIEVTGQDIVTQYSHDAYSRVIQQIQPDNTIITWTYAEHSDGEHPESVEVTTDN